MSSSTSTEPSTAASQPRASRAARVAALAFVALAVAPVLDVGFLSDDYYIRRRLDEVSRGSDSLPQAIAASFSQRFSETYEVYRPLTLATFQVDHFIFGTAGGRHHLTNLVLWVLLAWMTGRTARALLPAHPPALEAIAVLIAGTYPAAVEALAWLPARGDLLVAIFALWVLTQRLRRPSASWRPLVPTALALLSKETGIVLPPLLLLTDVLLLRGGRAGPRWTPALIRRHLPSFALAGGYYVFRTLHFGGGADVYGNQSFLDLLSPAHWPVLVSNLEGILVRLVFPVNESRIAMVAGATILVVAWAGVVIGCGIWLRRREPGRMARLVVVAFAWILVPLVLQAAALTVGPGLEGGRILTTAVPFLVVLPAATFAREASVRPARAGVALALFVAAATFLHRTAIGPYVDATARVERLLADLAPRHASEALAVGIATPAGDGSLHPSLMLLDGSHVISSGLFDAVHPPFRPRPCPIAPIAAEDPLLARLSGKASQPDLLTLCFDGAEPRLRVLGRQAAGPAIRPRAPSPAEPYPRSRGLEVAVDADPALPVALGALTMIAAEPGGGVLRGRVAAAAAPGPLVIPLDRLDPPPPHGILEVLPDPLVVWQVTWTLDGRVARSPWSSVLLAPP